MSLAMNLAFMAEQLTIFGTHILGKSLLISHWTMWHAMGQKVVYRIVNILRTQHALCMKKQESNVSLAALQVGEKSLKSTVSRNMHLRV